MRLLAFDACVNRLYSKADSLARLSATLAQKGACGALALAKARVEIARAIRLGDPVNGAYRAIDTLQRYLAETEPETTEYGLVAMHTGLAYLRARAYHNARPYYESAANIQQSGKKAHPEPGGNIYKPLAAIYTMVGDVEKAAELLKLAEEACLQANDLHNLTRTYYDQGLACLTMQDPGRALNALGKALSQISDHNAPPKLTADIYLHSQILSALAEAHLMLDEADKATRCALQALELDDLNADAALTLSQIAQQSGRRSDALRWNAQACKMLSEDDSGPESLLNRELAKAKVAQAKLLADTDIRTGLKRCAEALSLILPDFPPSALLSSPASTSIYPENAILEALETKADLLWRLYQRERQPSLLFLADSAATLALSAYDTLSSLFGFESATLYSQDELRDLHELGLKILFERARLADKADPEIGARIFRHIEKSRAVLLRQKLANMYLLKAGGPEAPDIQLEISLREQISDLRTQLARLEAGGLYNPQALRPLKARLFRLEDQRNQLLRELTQKQSGTLSALDKALKKSPHALLKQIDHEEKTHLVAYFYNAQSGDLYLYALSPESWQIQTANLPYKLIGDFMDIVKNGPVQQAHELDPAFLIDFAQRARELYSRLLEPLFGDSPPERLLLLPDGSLGDLPFDLLLHKTPQTNLDFRKLPYLLRCSVTRLAPSVSALLMPRPPASGAKRWGYLGFAPDYDHSPSLTPVRHGVATVRELAALFGGRYAVGSAATPEAFCRLAPRASILHFYGHGKANYAQPEYSWLAFTSDRDTESGLPAYSPNGALSQPNNKQYTLIPSGESPERFVFARQLNALRLDADIVMLSACETGVGRVYGGEGSQSLARGFMDIGSRSVCMTLWPVDDAATAKLSKRFLENIQKGMRKDEALRLAKSNFIEQELSAAPYLWAGFVLSGSDAPVEAIPRSWRLPWGDSGVPAWTALAAGLAMALLAIALWGRARRARTKAT
ncbi:MAG: CHAT domain-containing protein [Saprospiraceae bacterium]